jgi:outer membrane immunogenic protein
MKERPMRWMFYMLLILGMASPALAADYDLPILRGGSQPPAPVVTVGPATFTRWSGFYVGGVLSYSYSTADFSNTTLPQVASSLQQLNPEPFVSTFTVLGRGADSAIGGGGFLGYNTQWQDLILGVEATYTHTNLNPTSAKTLIDDTAAKPGRVFQANGAFYNLTRLSGTGNLDLTDYGSARFRAGYVVGNLLPYGFIGMAVGRASSSVTTQVNFEQNTLASSFPCPTGTSAIPTCLDFAVPNSAGQSNALLWGYSVGAGLDWALTQNIFLRGEFEFVQFAPISTISIAIISGRVGAGYKF